MRIDIATLFPEMCEEVLGESIIGRARKAGKLESTAQHRDSGPAPPGTPTAGARGC